MTDTEKLIKDLKQLGKYSSLEPNYLLLAAEKIEELSKRVEVKHGKWKQTEEPLGCRDIACAECSACGESWIIEEDFLIDDYVEFWKYCPCCGAKMESEVDTE